MRLLVITQAVDLDDPILGFFHRWLEEFAKQSEMLSVVCLKEGRHHLPANVHVYSLGKERGTSRVRRVTIFFRYLFMLNGEYNTVFVHMNKEYILLAGIFWHLLRIPIAFWYNHRLGNWSTELAGALSHTIFYTSPHSFFSKWKKASPMPVGIDTELFHSENSPSPRSLFYLGRISPVKHIEMILDGFAELKQKEQFSLEIIGSPVNPEDRAYEAFLQKHAGELGIGNLVHFSPGVLQEEAAKRYHDFGIMINATPEGAFDKTIFESMAAGVIPIVRSRALEEILSREYVFHDAKSLARAIEHAASLSESERNTFCERLRVYIVSHHSLNVLSKVLIQKLRSMRGQSSPVVFMINNLGFGGAERLVVDDMNEFIRRNIPVQLITLSHEREYSFLPECAIAGHMHDTIVFKNIYDVPQWVRLFFLLRRIKPRALHTHLWFSNVIGLIAGRLAGIHTIITFEHNVYDRVKTKKQFFIDRVLQHWSTAIVAVSDAVRESLIRHGIRPQTITVIPNGIDLLRYQRTTPKKPNDEFLFLFIGRLIHQKGVDTLIRAFAGLPRGKLWIAGRGEAGEALEGLAGELGVRERITFLGLRRDIPALMHEADCFVLPSRWEGLGIVLLEAMAAGIPIIATDFPAGRGIVKDGKTGLVVPIDDEERLRDAMLSVMQNKTLRKSLIQNGLHHVGAFSITHHVNALMRLHG